MKFLTLQEYFYKLQNFLYVFVIIPLLAFILIYLRMRDNLPILGENEDSRYLLVIILIGAISDWLFSSVFFNIKLRTIRNESGLRTRLEKYHQITVIRFAIIASANLILAIGFFLTGNEIFSVLLAVSLVLQIFLWPFSRKVCTDLKLKGDEREMVFYKKDSL